MEPLLLDRFRADLEPLIAPDARIGLAVSGGPDSLALLILAAAARPGQIEAATVDHGFRPEARDEAAMVAGICGKLGVPHTILTARWNDVPTTAIQERARRERYRLLGYWADERGLGGLATAHHADDQAITALKAFASAYPKHRRASYANNLIGRALLDKGDPRSAAQALLTNYRTNPGGERAPDSLYYLGQALMKLGQAAQACKAYAELEAVYPKVRADLKKQVEEAKAKAQCG